MIKDCNPKHHRNLDTSDKAPTETHYIQIISMMLISLPNLVNS